MNFFEKIFYCKAGLEGLNRILYHCSLPDGSRFGVRSNRSGRPTNVGVAL